MPLVEGFLLPENSSRSGDTRLPLVMIVGPTAVGKTGLSIQLAQALAGEIVSADSRLFYRGMDIGTAKPTAAERARVPHHLIDVANPDETWSLATFQERAFQAIAEIHSRRRLPFLVGGTGQYLARSHRAGRRRELSQICACARCWKPGLLKLVRRSCMLAWRG